MAKQNLDINLDTPELRAQMMSLAGVLKAGLSDAIQESFDPERFKLVTNDIVNLTKETARFADKILDNQNKLRSGAAKLSEIENQIFTAKKRQDNVSAALNRITQANLNLSREVNDAIKESVNLAKQEVKELENQAALARLIEIRVGRTSDLLKGITKIPFVGQFVKAEEALTAMNKKALETDNRLKIIAAGLDKSIGAITDAAALKVFGLIATSFKQFDTDAASLARSMNITYDTGFKFREQLSMAADKSGQIYATGAKYSKSLIEMNSALGTASSFDKGRIDSYTKLRDVAKFEPEVLEDVNTASLLNKKTLDDITKSRLAQINLVKLQTGRIINERQVLKDIANTSNAIKINFIGSDAALAKAAATARTMGTDLNKLDKIAGSFLNFETSIRNQMEAELITGRELNLEKARYYSLTNNTVGLQQELNKLNITADRYGKMNRIAQEATADALGMSREEISEMLVKQQAITNLGAKDLTQARAIFNENLKTMTFEEATAKLGDEALARQFQQQSYQERISMLVDKMLSAFDKLAPILKPIVGAFTAMAEMLAKSEKVLKAIVVLAGVLLAKKAYNFGAGMLGGLGGGGAAGGAVPAGAGRLAGRLRSSTTGQLLPGTTQGAGAGGGAAAGGSMFSSLNPMAAIKGFFTQPGALKSFLRSAGKIGAVSALFEGIFASSDIKDILASGGDKSRIYSAVGTRAIAGLGSVLGGAALGALLAPIPGGAIIGGIAGSYGGSWLGNKIGEAIGPDGLGKGIVDTFFGDEAKAAGLATGGLVTKGGLAQVDTGEVYLGKNSLETMKLLVEEMRAVKQAILSTGNTTLVIDGQKLEHL